MSRPRGSRSPLAPTTWTVSLRASCAPALLFQIKAALGPNENKNRAWKDCATCADLLSAFEVALARGQALARARILADPADDETLFLLGKLDLNYVWLQLDTLGRQAHSPLPTC